MSGFPHATHGMVYNIVAGVMFDGNGGVKLRKGRK
jgi:hypothetical protein